MRRALSGLFALLLVAACGTAPSLPLRREAVARQIADDAAAFNDAYGRAVAGQILLNILRSRDRLPRHYLSMTGIQDSPQLRWQENAGIGSIPLGEGASPWGFGSLHLQRETLSRPSYAVQPFGADVLTRTAFEATKPFVFAHYWRSGWPRDLLLLLMVERITHVDARGVVRTHANEANEIFSDCAESVRTEGCAFVREARGFLDAIGAQPAQRLSPDAADATAICGLVEAYAPTRTVRPAPPAADQHCDPLFVVGGDSYALRLRSLDDIVYYVGELMRVGSMNPDAEAIEAQLTIRAAGLRGGGAGVPLFRIVRAPRAEAEAPYAARQYFSASVEYGGTRLFSGPAIGRSCADATESGPCRDDAQHGDRSSSVLSLIAELMALNQSPDAIRAPNRLIAE